jgi:ATP-dependent Zn protease
LLDKRNQLDKMAKSLIKKEVLDHKEMKRIAKMVVKYPGEGGTRCDGL